MTLLECKECNEAAVGAIIEAYRSEEPDLKTMDPKAGVVVVSSISDERLEYVCECATALQVISKFSARPRIESTALINYMQRDG